MVTFPVKLCCLLPTPPPPHYDPDFRFQPRRRHEALKRGRQVCIPPLPQVQSSKLYHVTSSVVTHTPLIRFI